MPCPHRDPQTGAACALPEDHLHADPYGFHEAESGFPKWRKIEHVFAWGSRRPVGFMVNGVPAPVSSPR